MKKLISIFLILMVLSLSSCIIQVQATDTLPDDVQNAIDGMKDTSKITDADANSKISTTINNVIGLIQFAGTGISVVVVTMLGIKYLLASPSDKADTKKAIMPILIGCILLFAATNLVALVADFSSTLN